MGESECKGCRGWLACFKPELSATNNHQKAVLWHLQGNNVLKFSIFKQITVMNIYKMS